MALKDKTKIQPGVPGKVHERDGGCCIYCGSHEGLHLHHYVSRGRGGMGIEQNLVTLCWKCHRRLHDGDTFIKNFCRDYLQEHYEGWEENQLTAKERS